MAQYEYELTITRRDPNPDFKPERQGYPYAEPAFREHRQCLVTLNESEYQAVKQALVEHWAK